MLELIAMAALFTAFGLLVMLSIVDLRTRLLPNEMVLGYATLGFVFHLTTLAAYVSPVNIALGAAVGFLSLYLVRAGANYIYKKDALGLGDVKLMGAGGIWLGPEMIMVALSVGAFASLIHGFCVALYIAGKEKQKPDFTYLQIPAGPGFAVGLMIATILQLKDFFTLFQ